MLINERPGCSPLANHPCDVAMRPARRHWWFFVFQGFGGRVFAGKDKV
jgi:hypothetical protein